MQVTNDPRRELMVIVHSQGHPVTLKTNRGARMVGFASVADGWLFLHGRQPPMSLGTAEEILRLNPNAFPQQFTVFYLPSREAIESFRLDPGRFPTDVYLVSVTHVQAPRAAPGKGQQNEFTF